MSEHIVSTAQAMIALGKTYATDAKSGDVFGLIGTLGTGKTHWTKGFVSHIDPEAIVSSPTFGIVNEYRGGIHQVDHFDFYRLKSEDNLLEIGWDEYLENDGIRICEWADRFPELMPEATIWLQFTHTPEGARSVLRIDKPLRLDAAR